MAAVMADIGPMIARPISQDNSTPMIAATAVLAIWAPRTSDMVATAVLVAAPASSDSAPLKPLSRSASWDSLGRISSFNSISIFARAVAVFSNSDA